MAKSIEFLETCQKCNAKCCKMGGADLTEKEVKKILKAGYKNHFVKIAPNLYEMKSKKLRCPYLKKDNSCEIHDVRPTFCLCWPISPDVINEKKGVYLIKCPLTKLLSKKEIEKYEKILLKVDEKMLENHWKKSKLTKNEIKLIKKKMAKFKWRRLR